MSLRARVRMWPSSGRCATRRCIPASSVWAGNLGIAAPRPTQAALASLSGLGWYRHVHLNGCAWTSFQ